jgi:hypothetical protein
MTARQPWPWPAEMDALAAAPASHRVLLDNDRVRVLEVTIEPGTREPEHTHQAHSVMITWPRTLVPGSGSGGTAPAASGTCATRRG